MISSLSAASELKDYFQLGGREIFVKFLYAISVLLMCDFNKRARCAAEVLVFAVDDLQLAVDRRFWNSYGRKSFGF